MSTSKKVLITGGNKGIGLAATQKFISAGHKVYVLARDFADFLLKDHGQVEMIEYDLSNIAGIPDLVAQLPDIDILLNNAGVMFALPYQEYPREKIDRILKINLQAPAALITERVVVFMNGSTLSPVPQSDRILSLDLLRGVAVLGILVMNIQQHTAQAVSNQNIA